MVFVKSILSFVGAVAVDMLRGERDSTAESEQADHQTPVFYDPDGTAHAHGVDVSGEAMDDGWFDGKY